MPYDLLEMAVIICNLGILLMVLPREDRPEASSVVLGVDTPQPERKRIYPSYLTCSIKDGSATVESRILQRLISAILVHVDNAPTAIVGPT